MQSLREVSVKPFEEEINEFEPIPLDKLVEEKIGENSNESKNKQPRKIVPFDQLEEMEDEDLRVQERSENKTLDAKAMPHIDCLEA